MLPAAAPAGLEINRVLGVGKEAVVYGADCAGFDRAGFHFRQLQPMPEWGDAACLPWVQRACDAQQIAAIFPADRVAALWLAERRAQIPATILAPEPAALAACATRDAMRAALQGSVPVAPGTTDKSAQRSARIYVVDCFTTSGGALLYAEARAVGADGVTRPEKLADATDWGERIGARLGLRGAWHYTVQMERGQAADATPVLLDIMPLLAGDAAIASARGPNFPLLTLYDAAGYDLSVEAFAAEMPMALCLKPRFIYDRPMTAVYMDLDETLILRGAVNPWLVALIFQCRNRGIPVHLITRHPGDLATTLARYRLASLFTRIIHIADRAKPKAHFIEEADAVLIDDSFQERHAAVLRRGLRCFDAAGAVCLLDERL